MFASRLLLLGSLVLALCASEELPAQHPLDGRWDGAIQIMGTELLMAVEFVTSEGELSATIDIPQQGAHGLSLSAVRAQWDSVHFELPAGPGLAVWDGVMAADTIVGTFTQSAVTGDFRLVRVATPPELGAAPDDRPYTSEEVTVVSGNVILAGTLTIPDGVPPYPAVVLITGSGPQTRDEDVAGFPVFGVIADHLAQEGIVVLRLDDRGVGGSSGDLRESTSDHFAGDALSAVRFLEQRPEVDSDRIGLLGHSEGGIVAPLAAARSEDVSFLVLLAPPAVSGEEILLLQSELIMRAGGASDEMIDRQRRTQELIIRAVKTNDGWDDVEAILEEQMRESLESMTPEQRRSVTDEDEFVNTRVRASLENLRSRWFEYFIHHDPAETLRSVRVPVLGLYGELDLQVPPAQNAGVFEHTLRAAGNRNVLVRVFPRANHLFQAALSGSPQEYATLEKAFVPGFLDTISGWIRDLN